MAQREEQEQEQAPYAPLLVQMSTALVETYRRCLTASREKTQHEEPTAPMPAPSCDVPPASLPPQQQNRRVLSKKGTPCGNSGLDNEEQNLIVRVRDVLGGDDGRHPGYMALELLGQGTFGQVFRCQDLRSREFVAVKVIRNHPSYHKQAIVEVQITGLLNRRYSAEECIHMVRMRESFCFRNHLCVVFDLLSVNLYELITENNFRGFPMHITRGFLEQILRALVQLEDAGVIHCDLKPENILLAGQSQMYHPHSINGNQGPVPLIKVVDFGSACLENETVYSYIQSRFYRSPEVILGIPYNGAIDLWSVGCIAFELLMGLPLFPGVSEYDQLRLMEETLGPLPQSLLRRGRNVLKYYNAQRQTTGAAQFWNDELVLKTPEEFANENNREVQTAKKYFKHSRLEDILQAYPFRSESESGRANELFERRLFANFIRCLLNPDPKSRWTAREALSHQFFTGKALREDTQPYSYQYMPLYGDTGVEGYQPSPFQMAGPPTDGECGYYGSGTRSMTAATHPLYPISHPWVDGMYNVDVPYSEFKTENTSCPVYPNMVKVAPVQGSVYEDLSMGYDFQSTQQNFNGTPSGFGSSFPIRYTNGAFTEECYHQGSAYSQVLPYHNSQLVFPAELYPWMYGNRLPFGQQGSSMGTTNDESNAVRCDTTGIRDHPLHAVSSRRRRTGNRLNRNVHHTGVDKQRSTAGAAVRSHKYKTKSDQQSQTRFGCQFEIAPSSSEEQPRVGWRSPRKRHHKAMNGRPKRQPVKILPKGEVAHQEAATVYIEQHFPRGIKLESTTVSMAMPT